MKMLFLILLTGCFCKELAAGKQTGSLPLHFLAGMAGEKTFILEDASLRTALLELLHHPREVETVISHRQHPVERNSFQDITAKRVINYITPHPVEPACSFCKSIGLFLIFPKHSFW